MTGPADQRSPGVYKRGLHDWVLYDRYSRKSFRVGSTILEGPRVAELFETFTLNTCLDI